jgi:hypothetical protein
MEKGTVSVSMTVYEDFEAYSSGVYQHKTGKSLGGHGKNYQFYISYLLSLLYITSYQNDWLGR